MKKLITQILKLEEYLFNYHELNLNLNLKNKEHVKKIKTKTNTIKQMERKSRQRDLLAGEYLCKIDKPSLKKTISVMKAFFDSKFYANENNVPEKLAKIHYLLIGRKYFLNFTPYYDKEFVKNKYNIIDVDVVLFLETGIKLGLNPNKNFSSLWYLINYSDVADKKINPLKHYITYGWKEGRNPSYFFSSEKYLKRYPDVKNAEFEPLKHYLLHGRIEKRTASKTS